MRRLAVVGLAVACLAAGFLAGERVGDEGPDEPDVVGLNYVDPLPHLWIDSGVESLSGVDLSKFYKGLSPAVNRFYIRTLQWCYAHDDICVGAVPRPEALYLGLTQEHESTVQRLRNSLHIDPPETLRAFRAPYSLKDLAAINRDSLLEFLRIQAPDKVYASNASVMPALGKVLISVEGLDPSLAAALRQRFGKDKIVLMSTVGHVVVQPAEQTPP